MDSLGHLARLNLFPFVCMRPSLSVEIDQIHRALADLLKVPDYGDRLVDQKTQALARRWLKTEMSPGGLLDRLELFNTQETEAGRALPMARYELPVLITRAKVASIFLGCSALWQDRRDVEETLRSSHPRELRLVHQTYRMLRWAQAACCSPIAEIVLAFRENFPGILQLLQARSQAYPEGSVQRAMRDWLKTMRLETACTSMVRELPSSVLEGLVSSDESAERKEAMGQALRQLFRCSPDQISPALLDALMEGASSFLQWAELQGPGPLPQDSEQVACALLLRLLTEQDRSKQWSQRDQMILNRLWITRLARGIPAEHQDALYALVARRVSTLWTALCNEGQEQDLDHCLGIVKKLFPEVCHELGDRLPGLVGGWLHHHLAIDWQEDALPALRLISYLGVSARLALSGQEAGPPRLQSLFPTEGSHEQLARSWQVLAPLARSWPIELIIEGLGPRQKLGAHIKAMVASGHPQMAGRLLEKMEGAEVFLEQELEQLIEQHTSKTPVAWRWWAFLAAKGPACWPLGPEGERVQVLSNMLSRVVRAALERGTWSSETEIVLTALLNQGADPWRPVESSVGSPFEQTYLARLEKSLHKRYPGLLHVIDRIEDLLGVCPRKASPFDYLPSRRLLESPEGRRSVTSPSMR
jgi:hypothetical protein